MLLEVNFDGENMRMTEQTMKQEQLAIEPEEPRAPF